MIYSHKDGTPQRWPTESLLVSIPEACQLLGSIHPQSLAKLNIPAVKLGRRTMYLRKAVEKFVAQRAAEAGA
jgi:hypothetical protein